MPSPGLVQCPAAPGPSPPAPRRARPWGDSSREPGAGAAGRTRLRREVGGSGGWRQDPAVTQHAGKVTEGRGGRAGRVFNLGGSGGAAERGGREAAAGGTP